MLQMQQRKILSKHRPILQDELKMELFVCDQLHRIIFPPEQNLWPTLHPSHTNAPSPLLLLVPSFLVLFLLPFPPFPLSCRSSQAAAEAEPLTGWGNRAVLKLPLLVARKIASFSSFTSFHSQCSGATFRKSEPSSNDSLASTTCSYDHPSFLPSHPG